MQGGTCLQDEGVLQGDWVSHKDLQGVGVLLVGCILECGGVLLVERLSQCGGVLHGVGNLPGDSLQGRRDEIAEHLEQDGCLDIQHEGRFLQQDLDFFPNFEFSMQVGEMTGFSLGGEGFPQGGGVGNDDLQEGDFVQTGLQGGGE